MHLITCFLLTPCITQAEREARRQRRVRALVRQGQTREAAEAIAAEEFAEGGGAGGEVAGIP